MLGDCDILIIEIVNEMIRENTKNFIFQLKARFITEMINLDMKEKN